MGLFDFLKSKGETENSPKSENISFNGVCETPVNAKYTPDVISTLGPRDIFVFGSNLSGHHAGGAAGVPWNLNRRRREEAKLSNHTLIDSSNLQNMKKHLRFM